MGTSLNVSAWSTTAASNSGADSTIGTVADTSSPTSVDDWTRSIMAAVKKYVLDTDGGLTSGGAANAQTLTTNRSIDSGHQAAGFSLRFKAGYTNTGATTLAVDGLTAVAVKRLNGDALSAGDIVAGGIYDVAFDGTNYILMGAGTGSGTYGTLSGDNTWSGANVFQGSTTVGDGSGDTVVIKGTTVNSFVSGLFNSANAAAFYTAVGTVPLANGGTGSTTAAAAAAAILAGGVDVTVTSPAILKRNGSASANATVMRVQRTDTSDVTDAELIDFYGGTSTQVGSITTYRAGGVWNFTSYNTSSDGRVKQNQRPILDAGDIIDRLNPVRFEWLGSDVSDFGFIAQEVDAVVPGFVRKGDDNPDLRPGDEGFKRWQMQYGRLEPFLVAELQSLRKRVAALEAA